MGRNFLSSRRQHPPPYDPLKKAAEIAEHLGPSHAKLHSMAVDHQRAHAGMSYQSAYAYLYAKPENVSLRNAVKAEHMSATMAGLGQDLGKAAPPDPEQDYVDPSARTPAAAEILDRLVVTRMKSDPKLSYQQTFTTEYLAPKNRSLKQRYNFESGRWNRQNHSRHIAAQVSVDRVTWGAAVPNRRVMSGGDLSSPEAAVRPRLHSSTRLADRKRTRHPCSTLMAKDRRCLLHGLHAGQRGGSVPVSTGPPRLI